MKIAQPKLPQRLEAGTVESLREEREFEGVHFDGLDLPSATMSAVDFSSVMIEKCFFSSSQFIRMTMRDVRLTQTDLSSATMENGFLVRVQFVNCRLTALDFSRTSLHDVTFRGCKLDMANFRFSDLRRVEFIDCTFVEADFMHATLSNVEFQSSILDRVIFSQAKFKHVDVRSADLIDISGWSSMKGVTIDSAQLIRAAPSLAQEVGLIVRED